MIATSPQRLHHCKGRCAHRPAGPSVRGSAASQASLQGWALPSPALGAHSSFLYSPPVCLASCRGQREGWRSSSPTSRWPSSRRPSRSSVRQPGPISHSPKSPQPSCRLEQTAFLFCFWCPDDPQRAHAPCRTRPPSPASLADKDGERPSQLPTRSKRGRAWKGAVIAAQAGVGDCWSGWSSFETNPVPPPAVQAM